jgi:phospho-N-acetylmuramoyl-pentapeptide-transferase
MLYWLAELAPDIAVLNIFRYITFRTGGAVITALLFVFLFGPRVIRSLRVRQGKGQPIRKEGPERHILQKQGTPTMGGLMILSGVTVSVLPWGNLTNPYVWAVLLLTLVYGAVGLYDDYLKVTRQSAEGFRGRIKIVIETVAALFATAVIAFRRRLIEAAQRLEQGLEPQAPYDPDCYRVRAHAGLVPRDERDFPEQEEIRRAMLAP